MDAKEILTKLRAQRLEDSRTVIADDGLAIARLAIAPSDLAQCQVVVTSRAGAANAEKRLGLGFQVSKEPLVVRLLVGPFAHLLLDEAAGLAQLPVILLA